MNPLQRFHWHIDYLRQAAQLRAICYQCGENNEHRWTTALAEWPPFTPDSITAAGLGQPRLDGAGSEDLPLAITAYQNVADQGSAS